jgi:hypothetical protein
LPVREGTIKGSRFMVCPEEEKREQEHILDA